MQGNAKGGFVLLDSDTFEVRPLVYMRSCLKCIELIRLQGAAPAHNESAGASL